MDKKMKRYRGRGLLFSFLILAALVSLVGCSGAVEEVAEAAAESSAPAPGSAAEVTETFFAWYLDYIGEGEMQRNPLVDGAYRDSELLSPAFVEKVDRTVAGFEGGGYDPILLAQDVPVAIAVVESLEEGDSATVTVNRTFSGNPADYLMEVRLQRQGVAWQITDIVDPRAGKAASAVDAAAGFYAWYLAYIGEPATDTFRNPLVDRAYREAPYVSEAFVAAIDARLDGEIAEYGSIMSDPILQAQEIPTRFEVEVDPAAEVVTVNLFFGESTYTHPVQLRVVEQDGVWLIDSILPPG